MNDRTMWIHTIRLSTIDVGILEQVMRETGLARRIDALRFVIRDYERRHRNHDAD
ncbi:MAG: hypothetical protein KF764_25405 [Labilithrix sp.]|nr:hypothetical protein [Labilithrix sp.]